MEHSLSGDICIAVHPCIDKYIYIYMSWAHSLLWLAYSMAHGLCYGPQKYAKARLNPLIGQWTHRLFLQAVWPIEDV